MAAFCSAFSFCLFRNSASYTNFYIWGEWSGFCSTASYQRNMREAGTVTFNHSTCVIKRILSILIMGTACVTIHAYITTTKNIPCENNGWWLTLMLTFLSCSSFFCLWSSSSFLLRASTKNIYAVWLTFKLWSNDTRYNLSVYIAASYLLLEQVCGQVYET